MLFRSVDKLAIGSGAGESALEDKLAILAWLQAVLFQKTFQRRPKLPYVKHRLDRAAFLAAADQGAVRAFTEDNRRFAGKMDSNRLLRSTKLHLSPQEKPAPPLSGLRRKSVAIVKNRQ